MIPMLRTTPDFDLNQKSGTPLRRPLLLLLGAVLSAPASAQISDTLQPFVGVAYTYDDNLFRLPDGDPRVASDTIRSAFAGLGFERPVGRQVFSGSFRMSRVDFNDFKDLNYNGKDANLNWKWALGNHLDGTAGATYSETLNSFNDFHTTERNLRTSRGEFVDGGWRFHPSWRVRGRVSRDSYDYELAAQRYLDRDENRSEAGIDYLAASGSTIGLQARRTRGNYPNKLSIGGVIDDEGYRQTDLQLKVVWLYSAVTQVQFLGGRARREHVLSSDRDSSGTNGHLDVRWQPRVNLGVTLSAWREFQPFEGSVASYSMSKGGSLAADWNVTSKVVVKASVRRNKRDFDGLLAGVALVGDQQDATNQLSAGVTYMPLPRLTLAATVTRDSRSSNTLFSSQYRAKGAVLSANYQF
jgi:exopolysaccharide biosynthesis operon protein EpsL